MAKLVTHIKQGKGILAGAFSGFSWGVDALLISFVLLGVGEVSISTTLAVSMLHDGFAAVWLLGLLLLRGRLAEIAVALRQRDAIYCMLGALLGGPMAMTCYLLSIATAGVAVTTTVTACYPLLGAALSVLILKERVVRQTWIGLFLCLVGIVLTAYTPDATTGGSFAWSSLSFAGLAAVGWASESVVCAYGMRSDGIAPATALLIRETTSAVAYLVILAGFSMTGIYEGLPSLFSLFTMAKPLSLLVLTAFIGMSSFLAWYTSIDMIGPAKALGLNVTYAVWGVLLSAMFLDQTPSLWVLLGSLIVLLGVCYASLSSSKKVTPQA